MLYGTTFGTFDGSRGYGMVFKVKNDGTGFTLKMRSWQWRRGNLALTLPVPLVHIPHGATTLAGFHRSR